jgi:hypothetical protein
MVNMGSMAMTNHPSYQHTIRTYSALAKGNLWHFMNIYRWLGFIIIYSGSPHNDNPELETVFDAPADLAERFVKKK